MQKPKTVLITGASSGIGKALALTYAEPDITLALTGRNQARLAGVAADCEKRGAQILSQTLDVVAREPLAEWMRLVDQRAPLDLVIANAGISAGTGGGGETEEQARQIHAVNVRGVINTVMPAVDLMGPRGRGQIAIMSSLAAFRGFPSAPAYCASKAAVRVWGEGLRGSLRGLGLEVSVICPGYVKSPMTDVNAFPMPLLMDAEKAAGIIREGLARNRARIAFPFPTYAVAWLLGVLPPALTDPLLRRLPEKPAQS